MKRDILDSIVMGVLITYLPFFKIENHIVVSILMAGFIFSALCISKIDSIFEDED